MTQARIVNDVEVLREMGRDFWGFSALGRRGGKAALIFLESNLTNSILQVTEYETEEQ